MFWSHAARRLGGKKGSGRNGHTRRRLRRLVWAAASIAAFSMTSGGSPQQPTFELTPPHVPVPSSYFDMNILFHPLNHVPWPAAPLGGWRTSHTSWADLEPEPGQWRFDLLDKYVGWSQEHRVPILMPLAYTPPWASSTPNASTDVEPGNPPGLSGAPRDMNDWRVFVRTVATRYKGRIRNWEIWNEPNRPQSWTGSVEQMVVMAREAYTILKQIDPGCTVVSPAPTGVYGLKFFDAYLAAGGARYADVIGYHFYVGEHEPPESMVALIGRVKTIVAKYGLAAKPLWNTEAGWLGPDLLPSDTAAAWLAQAYLFNWAAGVSRFYWFAWENHHDTRIELVGKDNATLTPAGRAFVTIQTWMTGAVVTGCAGAANGIWTCAMTRSGPIAHVLWSVKGDTPFSIPDAWRAQEIDSLDGSKSSLQGKSIQIGLQPVLVQ